MEFTWYEKFTRMVEGVPDDSQRARLVDAVLGYGTYGREPEGLEWPLDTLFEGFRSDIDNSHAYRANGKANGKLGGRPRKQPKDADDEQETTPKTTPKTTPFSPKKERKKERKPGIAMKESDATKEEVAALSHVGYDTDEPTTFLVEVDEDIPLRASGRWAL